MGSVARPAPPRPARRVPGTSPAMPPNRPDDDRSPFPPGAFGPEPPDPHGLPAADLRGREVVPAAGVAVRRPAPRGGSGRGVSPWLVLVLLVIIGGLLFRLGWLTGPPLFDPHAEPRPVTPRGELAAVERDAVELFRTVSPSVVNVIGRAADGTNPLRPAPSVGAGSGFVWDGDGHIVTNDHVVRNADGWTVTLADGSTWEAELVGTYPDRDIAVLQIPAPAASLVPIMVGTSSDLQVGQQAFAIGSPFGLDQTFTSGVISGLGREINSEPVPRPVRPAAADPADRRDPDRRQHQPGQLRRPAAGQCRATDRDEHRDLQQERGLRRGGLRRARGRREPVRARPDPRRAGSSRSGWGSGWFPTPRCGGSPHRTCCRHRGRWSPPCCPGPVPTGPGCGASSGRAAGGGTRGTAT